MCLKLCTCLAGSKVMVFTSLAESEVNGHCCKPVRSKVKMVFMCTCLTGSKVKGHCCVPVRRGQKPGGVDVYLSTG